MGVAEKIIEETATRAAGGPAVAGGTGGTKPPPPGVPWKAFNAERARAAAAVRWDRSAPDERESAREMTGIMRRVHLRVLRAEGTAGLSALDDEDLVDEDEEVEEAAADDDGETAPTNRTARDRGDVDADDEPPAARAPRVRARTISIKRLSKRELEHGRLAYPLAETDAYERPKTREDCLHGPHASRPCPFVSCKHNLYLDVNELTGAIKVNFPDVEVWQMPETCTLDVADRGGITLEEVGEIMNLTRERVRQLEGRGVAKLQALADLGRLAAELDGEEELTETGHLARALHELSGPEIREFSPARSITRVRGVRSLGV